MTQQTERDALRKLAEAATPGPWAFGTFHRLLVVQTDKHGYADKHSAIADIGAGSIPWDATAESMQEYNDAEYIAAANPAAVITLLDQLQSQAERIKELETECEVERLRLTACGVAALGYFDGCKDEYKSASLDDVLRLNKRCTDLRAELGDLPEAQAEMLSEIKQLRAQLAEIAATEPVAYMVQFSPGSRWVELTKEEFDSDLDGHIVYKKQAFFTRPMPAQDVAELVEALEKLARLGNGEHYGNSDGNMIARDALSKYKGAK